MRKFGLFGILLLVSLSYGMPSSSQTPDGKTPARESICDPLKAGSVTKGLYGLCVAFCEAHDAADRSVPLTGEKLEKLLASKPDGRILQKYRNRMQDGDPDMPCLNVVVTANACPCWTEGQLVSADGRPDYNTVDKVTLDSIKSPPQLSELGLNASYFWVYLANFKYRNDGGNGRQCTYQRFDTADYSRSGVAYFGTEPNSPLYSKMTDRQAEFCEQQLQKHIDFVRSSGSGLSQ